MILVLIGIGSSELLCFGTASATMSPKCTNDNTITDGTAAFSDLTKTYELYATSPLTLSFTNFKTVAKIFSDEGAAVKVTVNDVETATKEKIELEKIELTLNGKGTITIKSAKLDPLSLLKQGADFSIKIEKLDCTKDVQIEKEQLLPTSEVTYTSENMVAVNHGEAETNIDGATFTNGMVANVQVNAQEGATLIYEKQSNAKILENEIPITIQSIAPGQTIIFDKNGDGYDFDNSHWKVTATVQTLLSISSFVDARKAIPPEYQHFFTLGNGARVRLEKYFDSYCIGLTGLEESCKERTLTHRELILPFYLTDKSNVTFVAYNTTMGPYPIYLEDLRGLDVMIKSGEATKGNITLEVTKASVFKENTFVFKDLEMKFEAIEATVVEFGKVKFFGSTVTSTIEPVAGKVPLVNIVGDEITSDIISLGGLRSLIKKQMSGGVIEERDVSKVSVSSDGKKMKVSKNSEEGEIEDDLFKGSLTLKVSGGSKESEDKRIPFEIETTTTTLKKMVEGSKTFDFSLEMPSGLSLYPVFVGDWSGYTIEVRGGDDFVYDSVTKAGSKGPKIENKSNNPIIVDGQEIVGKNGKDEQNKSGLSAGGIAGIVIACVVVVAAVGVTVFFVIKKRSKSNTL